MSWLFSTFNYLYPVKLLCNQQKSVTTLTINLNLYIQPDLVDLQIKNNTEYTSKKKRVNNQLIDLWSFESLTIKMHKFQVKHAHNPSLMFFYKFEC